MHDLAHSFVLAILQGLTEFLPVSSSAHLVLLPKLMRWPDQGLAFDIAVHFGTLIAIFLYFNRDLKLIIIDWCKSLTSLTPVKNFTLQEFNSNLTIYSKTGWAIILATIPVGIAGILGKNFIASYLRSYLVIATTTLIFGIALGFASWYNNKKLSQHRQQITWLDAAIIGLSQVLALIPGTSRSGITLTAGLILGLNKEQAAKFAFLLSVPVIVLAASLQTMQLISSPIAVNWQILLFGLIIAAIVGYGCIHYFLKLLNIYGVIPYVVYRLFLAIVLFAYF